MSEAFRIPKIIHYCWFGKGLMPHSQINCIRSWKKVMPDYEIKLWNENNFNVNMCAFTRDAYNLKKYSLVTDVVRLHALYTEGGIYMDTDVEVYKPFDEFLKFDFFSAVETYPEEFENYRHMIGPDGLPIDKSNIFTGSLAMLAAVIASVKGNPLIKNTLDYFLNQPFISEDGSLNIKIINPAVLAHEAIKFGFVYEDKIQYLDNNMLILPSHIFASTDFNFSQESYLKHFSAQSWVPKTKHELFLLRLDKMNLLKAYIKYVKAKRKLKKVFNTF